MVANDNAVAVGVVAGWKARRAAAKQFKDG